MTDQKRNEQIATREFLERWKPFIEALANVKVEFADETPTGSVPVILKPIPIINPTDPAG